MCRMELHKPWCNILRIEVQGVPRILVGFIIFFFYFLGHGQEIRRRAQSDNFVFVE